MTNQTVAAAQADELEPTIEQEPLSTADETGLTDEEKASLTQAEIDAIESDDSADPDPADDPSASTEVATVEKTSEEQQQQEEDQAQQLAATQHSSEQQKDDTEAANQLIATSELLTEFENKAQELLKQITDLGLKLDDGEVSQGAYDSQKMALERQLRAIDSDISSQKSVRDQLGRQIEQQQQAWEEKQQAAWNTDVNLFLAKPENEIFKTDEQAMNVLRDVVTKMTTSGMSEGLSPSQVLNSARAHVALRIQLPAPKVDEATAKAAKTRKTAPAIPPNLSQMQAVMSNGSEDGEFGHLDKLTGVAYETAFAKLTPAQQERFLNGS